MRQRLILTLITTAAVASLGVTQMLMARDAPVAEAPSTPLPPRVVLMPIRASQLHMGMTVADVGHIMGNASYSKAYVDDEREIQVLDFPPEPVGSKVTFAGGRLSNVVVDIARDAQGLPEFSRNAWTGISIQAVRRQLGAANEVRHHVFSGIDLDQLIFARQGEDIVSIFLVGDRVVTKRFGRAVPGDIFRVLLPAPPDATDETQSDGLVRIGMLDRDVNALYGAVRLQVSYTFNRQPAAHVIYETRTGGTFAGITFVDGVVTEFSDLGRLSIDQLGGG